MRFEGYFLRPSGKANRYWHIEVPVLGISTQGKSKQHALRMIGDAIELSIDKKGFRVDIQLTSTSENEFTVGANDPRILVAFMLRQQRSLHGLTLKEVSSRLKISSPNAYARYEQGKSVPTLDKLTELLHAIDPEREAILKIA